MFYKLLINILIIQLYLFNFVALHGNFFIGKFQGGVLHVLSRLVFQVQEVERNIFLDFRKC